MKTSNMDKIMMLDDLTSLQVSGSDATKFLHAQFTNDLANLPVNSWQYSGYCTPKGRLLAFMTIARIDENEYMLILPVEISEKVLPRLRMFVMRDDVKITSQIDHIRIIGIAGNVSALTDIVIPASGESGKVTKDGRSYLLTIDDGLTTNTERYMYIFDSDEINRFPQADSNRNDWTLLDIQAGIPAITAATQEAFVPQMVNLDLIGAVNFKKGCYPGQEVVARVHYLGKIKQRMFIVKSDGKTIALPDDKVYINGQEDKTAGTVVQSAIIGSHQLLQVVLQTAAVINNADIRLGSINGDKLIVDSQPYSILEEE